MQNTSTASKALSLALALLTSLSSLTATSSAFAADPIPHSIARQWDEMILSGIRVDLARPTVTARNLFNFSAAMYDAWAIYDQKAQPYYAKFKVQVPSGSTLEAARNESISYAAYRVLIQRYSNSPGAAKVIPQFKQLMTNLGYDINNTTVVGNTPAAYGNRVAAIVIAKCLADGGRETTGYDNPVGEYEPVNPPLIVKDSGVGKLVNVNAWQPLALDKIIDQGGNPIPGKVQASLTPFWGTLPPFGLLPQDKSPTKKGVWLDPGAPAQYAGLGDKDYRAAMEQVVEFGSWLDPRDNVRVDISPAALGNSPLGTNDGHGYPSNPVTGKPYQPQRVLRGDYARVLAEFWADGPTSETPPGHWNVMANYVSDQPTFKRQWQGKGEPLSPLEWDVKTYLTLNGALYDVSITAWGLKGFYNGSRPITAIRYMCGLGQATDPTLPSFNAGGIHLKDGIVELISPATTAPGARHEALKGHEGEIAVRAWAGAPADPTTQFSGTKWILGIDWVAYQRPTFVTPPFPGYVSGHSTFSRAAAEVLTDVTGSRFFPGGMATFVAKQNAYLVFEHGPSETVTLQWASYFDAADQSARSRIFGGIHGYIDDFTGRKLGSIIGKRSVKKSMTLF
jgi:hypothetical protein